MALYKYLAATSTGETTTGELEQGNREQVIEFLRDRGYVPIEVTSVESSGPTRQRRQRQGRRRPMTSAELGAFTADLAALIQARVPVDRALSVMQTGDSALAASNLARELEDQVRGGVSLADAMAASDTPTPTYYVPMLRAGEASGNVGPVLKSLADELLEDVALRQAIVSALRYPLFVLCLALLTVMLVFVYVVPEFQRLFDGRLDTLPAMTQLVFSTSTWLREFGWILPVVLLLGFLGAIRMHRSPRYRDAIDRQLLNLPIVGKLIVQRETARTTGALAMLLDSGVNILEAVTVTLQVIQNSAYKAELNQLPATLKSGKSLAVGLEASAHMPARAVQLVRLGEEGGRLPDMLKRCANLFAGDLRRDLDRALALLGPVLTIVLGLLVAGAIVAILGAIMTSYSLPL